MTIDTEFILSKYPGASLMENLIEVRPRRIPEFKKSSLNSDSGEHF